MKYFKINLATLSLIALTGCSSMQDLWLGEDKKDKLPGARIAINPQIDLSKIDNDYKNTIVSVPLKADIAMIETSVGIDSAKFPNLDLAENIRQSRTFSFRASKIFSSITSPLMVNNKLIILESNGNILAYDLSSGKKAWENNELEKRSARGAFNFTPNFYQGGLTYNNQVIFVTSGINNVMAINSETGELVWSAQIPSPTRAAPLIEGDMLFIQCLDNATYALNVKSGNIIWSHFGVKGEVSVISTTSLVFSNSILIAQLTTGEIVGIDATTGNELWSLNISSELERLSMQYQFYNSIYKLILDGSSLIAYDNQGTLAKFSLERGQTVWKQNYGINRPMWVCGELIIGVTESKELIALNKHNGKIKWKTGLSTFEDLKNKQETLWLEPVVANGKVLVVNSQGQLLEFDINTGNKLSEREVIKNVFIPPLIVDQKLYLVSNEGKIVEYSNNDTLQSS